MKLKHLLVLTLLVINELIFKRFSKDKNVKILMRPYIHNWSLQPFGQDYDLASNITSVVCFNFIHERWELQVWKRLRTTDFWETFDGNFISSHSLCQKFTERKLPQKYFFIFRFVGDVRAGDWTLASCLKS